MTKQKLIIYEPKLMKISTQNNAYLKGVHFSEGYKTEYHFLNAIIDKQRLLHEANNLLIINKPTIKKPKSNGKRNQKTSS